MCWCEVEDEIDGFEDDFGGRVVVIGVGDCLG